MLHDATGGSLRASPGHSAPRMRAAELAVQEAQASRTQIEASARSDAERVESVKAALVAAVGGTLGSLPYVVTSGTGASAA